MNSSPYPFLQLKSEDFHTIDAPFQFCSVSEPDPKHQFLHEAAVMPFKGVLYASWYNDESHELSGRTPIRAKRSYDGGRTWSEAEVIADDPSGKILYCPPVYGISDGKLYMMINEMVSADHMHALDLYVLDEESDRFVFLWSRPLPFKLNTNAVLLPNGKLMLPGRIAEMDGFPITPAVLISDSGKMDADWRLVYVAPDGNLPDGTQFVHPEVSVIHSEGKLYLFSRNDRSDYPIVYISDDLGETWSKPHTHDLPITKTKMYCGTLSDGRNYIVANTEHTDRSRLMLYLSKKGTMHFDKELLLHDSRTTASTPDYAWHYPAAEEMDGALKIIVTQGFCSPQRGAVLIDVPLASL